MASLRQHSVDLGQLVGGGSLSSRRIEALRIDKRVTFEGSSSSFARSACYAPFSPAGSGRCDALSGICAAFLETLGIRLLASIVTAFHLPDSKGHPFPQRQLDHACFGNGSHRRQGDLRDQLPAGSGTTSVSVPPNLPARRDPSTSCRRSRWPLRRSQAGDAPGHGVLNSPDRVAASESAIIRARQVAAWGKRAKVTAVVTEWVGINDMVDHRGLPVAIRPAETGFGLGRRIGTRPPGACSKKKRHLFRPFCVGVWRRLPVVRAGVARLPKLRQAGQFGAGRVATA
ncbi:hypothetical protein LOS78_16375 [Paracoccus sp. MA]|uniref:hypothetical protein n=1 Tax=Paracoccus sp. MA TaxID=2895796 RepID=UPI001E5CFA66|nr:hypothetical protein [Paracoccus sp. MA]UFM65220.1 hypothetical protein LOS78_16375 [Paracoccus sp. MA]